MRDDDTSPAPEATSASAEPLEIASPATHLEGAVRHERNLDLSPEEAWLLLGTSEGLEQWLGDRVDLDIAAGEHGTIRDGDELLQTEVESIERGRRLSLRWWSEERGATAVDLTLEPLGERRTRLVVVEVPVRALVVPSVAPFSGGGQPSTGPQLRAPRALALA